jgi:hypothetical protein
MLSHWVDEGQAPPLRRIQVCNRIYQVSSGWLCSMSTRSKERSRDDAGHSCKTLLPLA